MKLKTLLLIPTIFFIQSAIASSYTYVTDSVDIPIRSSAKIENNPSNVIRMVSSGDKLETLSVTETGWTQVKFENDTGWVISRYLTSVKTYTSRLNIDKVIVNHHKKLQRLNKRYKSLLNEIDELKEHLNIGDSKIMELFHLLEFKQTDADDIVNSREINVKLDTLLKVFNVDRELIDNLVALTIYVEDLEEKKKLEIIEFAKIQSELIKTEKKVKIETVKLNKIKSELENVKAKELYVQELKLIEEKSKNERYKEQQRMKKLKQINSEAEEKLRLIKEQIIQAEKTRKETEIARKKEKDKFKKEQSNRELRITLQLEEDLERVMASEDILRELEVSYIKQISSRVRDNWRYASAEDNWNCQVYILQSDNGTVESVNLQSCEIDDSAKAKAFKDSIERAIYKSSPLPKAPDESVFDREVFFNFSVN